jgi:uncharacterized protein YgbK (DUF1537 family)
MVRSRRAGGANTDGQDTGAEGWLGTGAAPALTEDEPPWLVVAGSQTEVTYHQVVELARAGAEIIELDVDELLVRRSMAEQAGWQAATLLRNDVTPVIRLVVSADAAGTRSRGNRLDETAARALARACHIAALESPTGGLFLTGGSTARACLLALGASGLRLEREPLPGIAAGVAIGGAWDGRPVMTKAGGFGAPDAIRRLVRPRSPGRVSIVGGRATPPVA